MKLWKIAVIGVFALISGGCFLLFGGKEEPVDFWQPVLSPDGRFLAYVAKPPGAQVYGLYLLDLETNVERLLVQMSQDVFFPSWSPDGTKLVFTGIQEKDNWDLFVVEVESGQVRRLTTDSAMDVNPYWAPNGLIIFNSNRDGSWAAWAINPDGTGLRKLSFSRPKS